MKKNKKFIPAVAVIVILSFLYSNLVWAYPDLEKETLAPQSELVTAARRLDIKASFLLEGVLSGIKGQVDLDTLWQLVQNANSLHGCLPVKKNDGNIIIFADGFNIEISTTPIESGHNIPDSSVWAKINYYLAGISSLNKEQRAYVEKNKKRLNNLLQRYGNGALSEQRFLDLDTITGLSDEEKDKLIDKLVVYINSEKNKALILLGNYFDMKGVYGALARKIEDEAKLNNIYALYKFTRESKYLPLRNLLCYPPIYKGDPNMPLLPLYQFVYRRALEHQYLEGTETKKERIVIEEFSPFFERDAKRIEDLEISAWQKNCDVVVRREKIRERHRRNPVYIIREGTNIVAGVATSCLKIGGEYTKIPKKYKLLIGAHNPLGDTIFDFSIFTDQDEKVKIKKYGDVLVKATMEIAKLQGMREVIAASRCEAFCGLLRKYHGLSFPGAIKEIRAFLKEKREEKRVSSEYQFEMGEILPEILNHYLGSKDKDFDLEKFIWEHLNNKRDPFLEVFHHRLGSKDVLVVLDSRSSDIRGLGAQVYTSYHADIESPEAKTKDVEVPEGAAVSLKPKYAFEFSAATRELNLQAMSERNEPLDILVIGGGIIGAGIARDAALRKLKVGLVSLGDFGSEASSEIQEFSLMHFHLKEVFKYLKLVFEAWRERKILLRIAPHLVWPLGFLIENVLSANKSGALIANYVGLVEFTYRARDKSKRPNGVIVEDKLTGKRFTIKAKSIVDASGINFTFYRLAAKEITDRICEELGLSKEAECITDKQPLFGGNTGNLDKYLSQNIPEAVGAYGISIKTAEYLIREYGSQYKKVLGLIGERPELVERISSHLPYIKAEIVYSVYYEMAVHLKDLMIHRTSIGFQENIYMDTVWEIARIQGAELKWSCEKIAEEVRNYVEYSHSRNIKKGIMDKSNKRILPIIAKMVDKDKNLTLVNNLGVLNLLIGMPYYFPAYTRFRSKRELHRYLDNRKKENFLRLIVSYYILFADGLLGYEKTTIAEKDLAYALAFKLIEEFGIELEQEEIQFLSEYILEIIELINEAERSSLPVNEVQAETVFLSKKPGMLYFDIDKIIEETQEVSAKYMDMLEKLTDDSNYAVVIVNSCPDRSMNKILGKHPLLRRITRKSIVINAREGEGGQALIERAIEKAIEKLNIDTIPAENITLAIYEPNSWQYELELLKEFSVVIMTAKSVKLDKKELKELEKLLPGITKIIENTGGILLEERREELGGLGEQEQVIGKGA